MNQQGTHIFWRFFKYTHNMTNCKRAGLYCHQNIIFIACCNVVQVYNRLQITFVILIITWVQWRLSNFWFVKQFEPCTQVQLSNITACTCISQDQGHQLIEYLMSLLANKHFFVHLVSIHRETGKVPLLAVFQTFLRADWSVNTNKSLSCCPEESRGWPHCIDKFEFLGGRFGIKKTFE